MRVALQSGALRLASRSTGSLRHWFGKCPTADDFVADRYAVAIDNHEIDRCGCPCSESVAPFKATRPRCEVDDRSRQSHSNFGMRRRPAAFSSSAEFYPK